MITANQGNKEILKLHKTAFLCSRRVPASVVLKSYDWAIQQREMGNCVISGFHSRLERDVLHYLLKGKQSIIIALARGLKERIEPEFKIPLEQGRILFITPFRGATILAASMLDQKLKTILEDYLIKCKATELLLEGFNAPIGTFSSRQQLAFSLGLISEYEYHDCEIVRKIRNEFAHKFQLKFAFTDNKVASLCYNLKAPTPGEKSTFKDKPRFLFVNSVSTLYLNWLYREDYVKQIRLTRHDWYDITWNKRTIKSDKI